MPWALIPSRRRRHRPNPPSFPSTGPFTRQRKVPRAFHVASGQKRVCTRESDSVSDVGWSFNDDLTAAVYSPRATIYPRPLPLAQARTSTLASTLAQPRPYPRQASMLTDQRADTPLSSDQRPSNTILLVVYHYNVLTVYDIATKERIPSGTRLGFLSENGDWDVWGGRVDAFGRDHRQILGGE